MLFSPVIIIIFTLASATARCARQANTVPGTVHIYIIPVYHSIIYWSLQLCSSAPSAHLTAFTRIHTSKATREDRGEGRASERRAEKRPFFRFFSWHRQRKQKKKKAARSFLSKRHLTNRTRSRNMGPALAQRAAALTCTLGPCFARANPVSRVVLGGVVAPRGSQTARLRVAATRPPMLAAAVAVVAPAPRMQRHHSHNNRGCGVGGGSCAGWMRTKVGVSGSRGFGCGAASTNRRGIASAAAKKGGDADDALGEEGDDVLAPAPSDADQARMDKEAAAFAASWASELSAAAWDEMEEEQTVSR